MRTSPLRAAAPAPRWLLLLLLLVVVLAAVAEASTRGLSVRCEPLPEPEDCLYGLARDHCGRFVCAKGPGERCGGPMHLTCGEGMYCKCERCIGCSLNTFTCFLGSALCM
ncbi:Neuroparsin 1 [Frankliniella occidentalis]|uniref:Neuroparsin-A-like n=1 Tax=Frankliniella occidentalis TaxID=133901 RepID=A0A6J1S3U7_FRAOC|nr:neuroparsin-A-like [Frankliniella occidentalis]KAE8744047.1 Neuroparsin 1 [Frankliniella occidentalis]